MGCFADDFHFLDLARRVPLGSALRCAAVAGGPAAGVGPVASGIGAALFVCYGFTRFLVAWANGFQDLVVLLLILAALDALLSGRRSLALMWALLAPFAKESAFIVFPLLAA